MAKMASSKELLVHLRFALEQRHPVWQERVVRPTTTLDDAKVDPLPRLEMFQRQCTGHIKFPSFELGTTPVQASTDVYSQFKSIHLIYTENGVQCIHELAVNEQLHSELAEFKQTHPDTRIVEDDYLAVQGQTLAETDPKYKGRIDASKIGAKLANDRHFLDALLEFHDALDTVCYKAWLANE